MRQTFVATRRGRYRPVRGRRPQAKTLKFQAGSRSGDWARRFMTDGWQQKVEQMTGGGLKIEVRRRARRAAPGGDRRGREWHPGWRPERCIVLRGPDPGFAIIGDLIAGYDTPEQVRAFCQRAGAKRFSRSSMTPMRTGTSTLSVVARTARKRWSPRFRSTHSPTSRA